MPAVSIEPEDLEPFTTDDPIPSEKAEAMIADALAWARVIAPCIGDEDFAYPDAAKGIIRGAILRWNETGVAGRTQVSHTVGPFGTSESYQQPARRTLFLPPEEDRLKSLCAGSSSRGAWGYDTIGCDVVQHTDVCSVNFGAAYCSCGAVLTGVWPLWENGGG